VRHVGGDRRLQYVGTSTVGRQVTREGASIIDE